MKRFLLNFLLFFFIGGAKSSSNTSTTQEKNPVSSESKNDEEIISICMATDDNYAQHAGVTIASILKNAAQDDKIRIFILHRGLKQENIQKLQQLQSIKQFELVFKKIDLQKVKELKLNHSDLSLETWFRLFIPDLCTECTKKILYMDVDMVVLKSLKELWNTDVTDYYAAVVDDFTEIDGGKYTYKREDLKLSPPYRYFNAGLILFNLEKCAKNQVFEKALAFGLENSHRLKFEDQDTMNIIMEGNLRYIHPKFNVQNSNPRILFNPKRYSVLNFSYKECIEAFKDPVIIHFVSKKPWHIFSAHPHRNLYYKYLALTPWKENSYWISDLWYDIKTSIKSIWYLISDFLLNRTLPV